LKNEGLICCEKEGGKKKKKKRKKKTIKNVPQQTPEKSRYLKTA
jgi:hypothetical protein